jgi:hypothetical protein
MDTKVDDQHRDIVYQDQRVEKAVGVFIEGAVRSKWESLPRLQIRRLFWKLALCCLAHQAVRYRGRLHRRSHHNSVDIRYLGSHRFSVPMGVSLLTLAV